MNTALIGLDYIVDIMHPDGRIARCAEQAALRGVVARFNRASPSPSSVAGCGSR